MHAPKEEVEQIIAFVKRKESVRWTDLEKEFVTRRNWSKGKFVNHWKKAKRYLDKVPDPETGYGRYMLKEMSRIAAEKAVLKSDIDLGSLTDVVVGPDRFSRVTDYLVKKYDDQFSMMAFQKAEKDMMSIEGPKDKSREAAGVAFARLLGKPIAQKAAMQARFTSYLNKLSKHLQIRIVTPEGETPPFLTDDDIEKIFDIAFSKLFDENLGRVRTKTFHIVITFPTEEL